MTKRETIATSKYHKKKYDRMTTLLLKGHKDDLKALAASQGESLNTFVTQAIDERIEALRGHPKPQYQTPEAKEAIKNLRVKGDEKG